VGVDTSEIDAKVRKMIPGYMTMGTTGMRDMTRTGMPLPVNSIPMRGYKGQFGQTVLGSMANVLRVRETIENYDDTGPYDFPKGTVARKALPAELRADGIIPPDLPEESRRLHRQDRMMRHHLHGTHNK